MKTLWHAHLILVGHRSVATVCFYMVLSYEGFHGFIFFNIDNMVATTAAAKLEVPRGKPVSGRPWKKVQKSRNSMQTYKATKVLSTTWDQNLAMKGKKREMKELEREIADRKKQERLDKKLAREEKEKRRLANELKSASVQVISKTGKLKTMSKKQLRNIKKTRMTKSGVVEYVPVYSK